MKSEAVAVDVILRLGNASTAEYIERALRFYSAAYSDSSDPSIAFEVLCKGLQAANEYRLTFVGSGADLGQIADGVHRFMESFLDEFYDESVEEDWLCELGCEALPTIIDYDVDTARSCGEDE